MYSCTVWDPEQFQIWRHGCHEAFLWWLFCCCNIYLDCAHLRNTNSMPFLCVLSIKILINVSLSCFHLNYRFYLYHRGPRQAICDWWWEGFRSCTLSQSRSPLWFLKSAVQPLAAGKKKNLVDYSCFRWIPIITLCTPNKSSPMLWQMLLACSMLYTV